MGIIAGGNAMNMRSRWAILIVGASLAATGHTSWAGSEHEFSKDGHSYKYVWRQYLDAQIVRPRPGREVRVLALRSGLLQQKASNQFLDLRKVVGLWQATLDPEGRIAQNEMVLDLTTRLLEQHKLVLVPPATLNARMMSACPDALGQIHVFVALPVWNDKSDFQNRLFYLREKQNNWKELITGPQSSFFPYLTAFSAGDSVQVYYLQNVKDPDPPLLLHSLPVNRPMDDKPWRLFTSPGPYPIRACDFTAFASAKDLIVVFREKGSTALSLARWPENRKSWDVRKNVFSPRIGGALVGDALTGLSGLATADGVIHVFATLHFNDQRQILHLSAGKEDSWSGGVILNQSADWLSAALDAQGRIHLIGVNEKGAVWYALGNTRDSWSFKGSLLDENTKQTR
jgi:hypothetical protein